jgi:hypothetical protein
MLDVELLGVEMFEVDVLRGSQLGAGVVLCDGAGATVAMPGLDGARTIPTELVAGWLAALVELGPRPRPVCCGHLVTDRAAVETLLAGPLRPSALGGGVDVRAVLDQPQLSDGWASSLAGLASGEAGHWRVGPLEIVDGGDAGLWQVTAVDDRWLADELDGAVLPDRPVALHPTDPTQVWTALAGLASRLIGYRTLEPAR